MRQMQKIRQLTERLRAKITQEKLAAQGGVYPCQTDEDFDATAEWPKAGPCEIGKLIAPRQCATTEEWIAHMERMRQGKVSK